MDKELFERLANAYGADLKKWPSQHQSAAAAFLTSTPATSESLAGAWNLDCLLDAYPAPRASNGLKQRIAATTALGNDTGVFILWFAGRLKPYAALFVLLAFVGGWSGMSPLGGILHSQEWIDNAIVSTAFGPLSNEGEL